MDRNVIHSQLDKDILGSNTNIPNEKIIEIHKFLNIIIDNYEGRIKELENIIGGYKATTIVLAKENDFFKYKFDIILKYFNSEIHSCLQASKTGTIRNNNELFIYNQTRIEVLKEIQKIIEKVD